MEDKIKEDLALIENAAKRANSDLLTKTIEDNPSSPRTLPKITNEEKRKILTNLGLKNINRIGNIHSLMRKANLE